MKESDKKTLSILKSCKSGNFWHINKYRSINFFILAWILKAKIDFVYITKTPKLTFDNVFPIVFCIIESIYHLVWISDIFLIGCFLKSVILPSDIKFHSVKSNLRVEMIIFPLSSQMQIASSLNWFRYVVERKSGTMLPGNGMN